MLKITKYNCLALAVALALAAHVPPFYPLSKSGYATVTRTITRTEEQTKLERTL